MKILAKKSRCDISTQRHPSPFSVHRGKQHLKGLTSAESIFTAKVLLNVQQYFGLQPWEGSQNEWCKFLDSYWKKS